jgi:hypothetical protein
MAVEAIDVDVDVKGHEAVPAKNGRVLGLGHSPTVIQVFRSPLLYSQVKNSTLIPTRNTHKIRIA